MVGSAQREPVDGVDVLQKRGRTRLWYRQEAPEQSPLTPMESPAGMPASAVRITRTQDVAPIGTDHLIREEVQVSRGLAEIKAMLAAADVALAEASPSHDPIHAISNWRSTPSHCPVLLLSSTQILDARNPGPILGPGTRYRILAVDDGVVALQIASLDGQVAVGYCNAVDLICFEPDIVYYRRERQTGKLGTARLNLNKLSQRISGVTASLVG